MKFITTESSKKRNAPYSPGVIHNGILYVSGPLHFGSLVEIEAMAAVPEEK